MNKESTMNKTSALLGSLVIFGLLLVAANAYSSEFVHSNVGAGGYDVVAYHTEGSAMRGTGWHVATYDSTTYLFSTKKNRKIFLKNPEQYLPEYGGFCAYGLAVGKKFYADPTVWKIVDGKLYLNLDSKIQKKFESNLTANIEKADTNWPKLQNEKPTGL